MIQIKKLKVGINDKQILNGISLDLEIGKNYCLLGKNGSGKSTLSAFLMGHPKYKYMEGSIEIDGENLLELEPNKRSERGLFLSFQSVPEIAGIRLSEYLRIIYTQSVDFKKSGAKDLSPFIFKRFVKKILDELCIDESFLDRELNLGFSGGEKRKIEILQMKLIGPKYIILDEIDSGLDLDAFKVIANLLKNLSSENNSLIIITHNFKILEYINVDKVFILKDGNLVKQGDKTLINEITNDGFEKL